MAERENPHFAGTEIVEIGIQIERNGRDFYAGLVKKLKSEPAKELFKYMAAEEEQHIEDFKKILASVKKYQPYQSYPEEYFAYLRAMASEQVFVEKEVGEKAREVTAEREAIDVSIGLEKDSILFYQEMKEFLSENDAKIVDQVIAQEKEHVRKLWNLRSKS